MRILRSAIVAAAVCCATSQVLAVEGPSGAGPIGGTDIRSALLPAPGFYGGLLVSYAQARQFFDGSGHLVPLLRALHVSRTRAAPFVLFVPDAELLGGSLGVLATLPAGSECGRRFAPTPSQCIGGTADPYVEVMWSRFFGTRRPSIDPRTLPIPEGLTVSLGLGVVIPSGRYNITDATKQGLAPGGNVWDVAPTAAVTYVTAPILAEGTEFSAKVYWNNYSINPDTQYASGSTVNVTFAVTERAGRFQVGLAGNYLTQIGDDKFLGARVLPDGRRAEVLALGGVLAYDMPEYGMTVKIKGLAAVLNRNASESAGIVVGLAKKFAQ